MGSSQFKLAVLASGRGTNLQAIVDSAERKDFGAEIALILSDVKDAQALERGKNHGIESVFLDPKDYSGQGKYDAEIAGVLRSKGVDLVCLAGFMRIIKKPLLEAFSGRIINVHPSLLPAFPGLDAPRQALDHGAKFTGCTIHFVDESVDGGPIILQSVVPIYDRDDLEALSQRILEQEHLLYPKAIKLIMEGRLAWAGRKVLQVKKEPSPVR